LALNSVFKILKTLVNLSWKIKGLISLTLVSSAKRIGEEILFNTRARAPRWILGGLHVKFHPNLNMCVDYNV
jgi:hypothetical protein